MSIITFLKNRHKKQLSKKIIKLKKRSTQYLEKSCYFEECLELFDESSTLYQYYLFLDFLPYSFLKSFNTSPSLAFNFYNNYLHYSFMHDRVEAKIKNLEKKLKQL